MPMHYIVISVWELRLQLQYNEPNLQCNMHSLKCVSINVISVEQKCNSVDHLLSAKYFQVLHYDDDDDDDDPCSSLPAFSSSSISVLSIVTSRLKNISKIQSANTLIFFCNVGRCTK
jgi:hypothetical protein